VYGKTGQGRAEVAQRALGLNARQRSVLIMFDGSKSCVAVGAMLPDGELAQIVASLLHWQLIAAVGAAPHIAAPQVPATGEALPGAQLLAIRTFMRDSARRFLGLMAADVTRRIDAAASAAQLLAVLGHWHMAMHESKQGKIFAQAHMAQLKASFDGQAVPGLPPQPMI
jgi:hypothetical protein